MALLVIKVAAEHFRFHIGWKLCSKWMLQRVFLFANWTRLLLISLVDFVRSTFRRRNARKHEKKNDGSSRIPVRSSVKSCIEHRGVRSQSGLFSATPAVHDFMHCWWVCVSRMRIPIYLRATLLPTLSNQGNNVGIAVVFFRACMRICTGSMHLDGSPLRKPFYSRDRTWIKPELLLWHDDTIVPRERDRTMNGGLLSSLLFI